MRFSPLRLAGLFGAAGVACGAFGAHGLAARLAETGYAAQWGTAAQYHLLHAAALGLCALPGLSPKARRVASRSFSAGILLFSGSLYVLATTGIKWLGAVTPIGGVLMIVGWLALAVGAADGQSGSGERTASP